MAIQRVRPEFVATNLITTEDRAARVVLEANRDHNTPRTARLERVVFRNDLTPQQALEAVCDREGEVDIVTEVSPADAQRVEASGHARLVTIDANRLLVGIFNTWASNAVPLGDVRMREALNWAVDRHRMAAEALAGYATPLAAMTPAWCAGVFPAAAILPGLGSWRPRPAGPRGGRCASPPRGRSRAWRGWRPRTSRTRSASPRR
jgi:ABC-type transport system substrate-binding protein